MAKHSQFRSLLLFKENIEFKASLLESRVDAKLLRSLDPTPADVFEEATKVEGATQQNLMFFLKLLKDLRTPKGNQSLVTEDGLDFLANVLWQVSWKTTSSVTQAQKGSAGQSEQQVQRAQDCIASQDKRAKGNTAAGGQQAKRKLAPNQINAQEKPAAKRAAGAGEGGKPGPHAVASSSAARGAQGGNRRGTPPPNPLTSSPSFRLPPTTSVPCMDNAEDDRAVRRNFSNPERHRRRTPERGARPGNGVSLATMRTLSDGSLPKGETAKEMNDLPLVRALMDIQSATTKRDCEEVKIAILKFYKSPSMPKLTRSIADIARGNEKAEQAALKLKSALPSALRDDFESQLQMFLTASVAGRSPKADAPHPLTTNTNRRPSPARTMSPPSSPLAALAAVAAAAAEAAAAAPSATTPAGNTISVSPRSKRAASPGNVSAGAGTSGSGGPAKTRSDNCAMSRDASPAPQPLHDGGRTPKRHSRAPSLAEVCAAVDGIAQLQVKGAGQPLELPRGISLTPAPSSPPPPPPPSRVQAGNEHLYSMHSRGSAGTVLAGALSTPVPMDASTGMTKRPSADLPREGTLVIKIEPEVSDNKPEIMP